MKREAQKSVRCGRFWPVVIACALLAVQGCSRTASQPALVLTQAPLKSSSHLTLRDALDQRYPAGSRVVRTYGTFKGLEVLSEGLYAAGDPQVSFDGRRVLFCGKAKPEAEWQIFEWDFATRRPRALTAMAGGAANPAWLPDERVLFVSPVPRVGATNAAAGVLYAQTGGHEPQALTFTSMSVSDPTVLQDGRILFVGRRSGRVAQDTPTCGLYTINNDGTEMTQFSGTIAGLIRQPRQTGGHHISYLLAKSASECETEAAEFIRCAQPFGTAEPFPFAHAVRLGSVQPAANGELLIGAEAVPGSKGPRRLAIYRISPDTATLGQPIFVDPKWDSFEAAELSPHEQPMGRLSTIDPTKDSGQILCLDVNYTSLSSSKTPSEPAARIRVVAGAGADQVRVLGEAPVQADGSFMAEVPADVPLGLEALDNQGNVLRRLAPTIWVRPGENRSCIGCHEPPNHAPKNHRPLAVRAPVPRFTLASPSLAKENP